MDDFVVKILVAFDICSNIKSAEVYAKTLDTIQKNDLIELYRVSHGKFRRAKYAGSTTDPTSP